MESEPFRILDCTLRDGGYYNSWRFSPTFVRDYFSLISELGISHCELGFRSPHLQSDAGVSAFTPETFLESLEESSTDIGVMINASEYSESPAQQVKNTFRSAHESRVSFVRIAANKNEFECVKVLVDTFRQLGYKIFVNLMKMHALNGENYEEIVRILDSSKDTLYLADSFGKLTPISVSKIFNELNGYWSGASGIHAHNNHDLALANSLAALESGATWVDATFLGMGRGPGNTRTDSLLGLMTDTLSSLNNLESISEFIEKHMYPLLEKYRWGPNPLYAFAAKNEIHPLLVQTMSEQRNSHSTYWFLSNVRLDQGKDDLIKVLDEFGDAGTFTSIKTGNFQPNPNWAESEFIVMANTAELQENLRYINAYRQEKKCVLLIINPDSFTPIEYFDLAPVVHPLRFEIIGKIDKKFQNKVVSPVEYISNILSISLETIHLNYPLNLKTHTFLVEENGCTLSKPLGISYAIALAIRCRASEVTLVGFSGKNLRDFQKDEVNSAVAEIKNAYPNLTIRSFGNTFIHIDSLSIFGLLALEKK